MPEPDILGCQLAAKELMKIVLLTALYSAKGGGVASVSRLLVRGLRGRNHDVMVLTSEDCPGEVGRNLISRPSFIVLIRQILASDAVIMQGCVISLGWPLLLIKRKALMVRHMLQSKQSFIRRFFSRRVKLATVSEFMATRELSECFILPNPYDDRVFFNKRSSVRTKDLLFVSRLVAGKGVMELLNVFERLMKIRNYSLTIIGEGDQLEQCELFVRRHNLSGNVSLLGHQEPAQIAEQMRRHRILVMPSLLEEAFGLVVIEGLACGCSVVASNRGGIPEALGGFGVLYDADDAGVLYTELKKQLAHCTPYPMKKIGGHLESHKPSAVAAEYEKLLFGGLI